MSWLLNNPIGDRWNPMVRHYAEMYENEYLKGSLSMSSLFEIASVMVRSKCSSYIRRGLHILEHLCTSVDSVAIHKSYLIYLSIGYIRIREYDLAKNTINYLLVIDPRNRQAIELDICIQRYKEEDQNKATIQEEVELTSIYGSPIYSTICKD